MSDDQVRDELDALERADDAVGNLDWPKAAGAYRAAYSLAVSDRASLDSQNQALQEALRAIRDATGDYPNDRVAVLRQRLYEIERLARNALSPTQETDPE